MLLEKIAQNVAENTSEILGYPISITDEKGYIIGSTDQSRLGTFHKASIDVLKRNEMICYELQDVQSLQNVLPGVASPIFFDKKAIGVLGIIGNPKEVKKYVQLVKSHVEMMCQESFLKEMSVLETKAIDTLIQSLIHFDTNEDVEQILRYGKILGYNLELTRVCLLLEIDTLSLHLSQQQSESTEKFSLQYIQKDLTEHVKHIFEDSKEDIVSLLNLEQFIILKSVPFEENHQLLIKRIERKLHKLNDLLTKKYHLTAAIAIGDAKRGVYGLAESCQNALRALEAGKKTKLEPRLYYCNDWNIMLELLTREVNPLMQKKLTQSVSAFIEYDNFDTLANTFLAYCKCNMNVSETARTLFIHRNTLVYRLEKIGELTSLDLTNFEHCLLLYVTIKNFQHTPSNSCSSWDYSRASSENMATPRLSAEP